MRAAVVDRYGPPEVVRLAEVARPVPADDEVLVRVVAVAVTSGDARIRAGRFPPGFAVPARLAFGLRRPRRAVLGSCLSGTVEASGPGAAAFVPGDEVCAMTGTRMGAHAEYVTVPVGRLARVPPGVSHEDAAGVLFGGTAALCFLRDRASVGAGNSVLVNGASGAVGTNAVQIARHLGATVTAVTSAANAELVTGLGAQRVIDYTRTDVTGLTERFDVVLDTVGNLTITTGRPLLAPDGVLVLAVASLGDTIRARGNVVAGSAPERVQDFDHLLTLITAGALTVVHDRTFGLDGIVEAHRRVDSSHKVGNIILRP
jgi:NADPH:quinone reductase-like Zn-dependent oxidoreductase